MEELKIKGYIVKRGKDEKSIASGGLLKIDPASDQYVQLLMSKLKHYGGEKLDITFTDEQSWSSRTNRLFHGLIRKIYNEGATQFWGIMGRAPRTFDETRDWILCTMCGAHYEIVEQYMGIESWKDFSKKRALQAIDNVIQYCMDVGVDIDSDRLEYNDLRGGNNA